MPTVYKILDITPTDNYSEIKKAYFRKAKEYHPDKNPGDADAAAERFKLLAEAYGQVNNAEEAKLFFTWFNQQDPAPDHTTLRTSSSIPSWTHSSSDATPEPAHASSSYNPPAPGEGIRVYTEEKVDVFMVIGVNALFDWEDYGKEWSPAAFSFIAARLESLCEKYDSQVGVTSEEAIEITNQHSHREGGIVVHFRIRLADLSEQKASEQDLVKSSWDIAHAYGSKTYFLILANTKFTADDIISFRPMVYDPVYRSLQTEYYNTVRFSDDEFIEASKRWPGAPLVVNPSNQLMYSRLQPTVSVTPSGSSLLASNTELTSSSSEFIAGSRRWPGISLVANPSRRSQPRVPVTLSGSSSAASSSELTSSSSASVIPHSIFPAAPDSLTELRNLISGYQKQNNTLTLFSRTIPKLLGAQTIRTIGDIAHADQTSFLPRSKNYQRFINTLAQLKNHPEKVQSVITQLQALTRSTDMPSSSLSSGFH